MLKQCDPNLNWRNIRPLFCAIENTYNHHTPRSVGPLACCFCAHVRAGPSCYQVTTTNAPGQSADVPLCPCEERCPTSAPKPVKRRHALPPTKVAEHVSQEVFNFPCLSLWAMFIEWRHVMTQTRSWFTLKHTQLALSSSTNEGCSENKIFWA